MGWMLRGSPRTCVRTKVVECVASARRHAGAPPRPGDPRLGAHRPSMAAFGVCAGIRCVGDTSSLIRCSTASPAHRHAPWPGCAPPHP